jgi:hypothetical protein
MFLQKPTVRCSSNELHLPELHLPVFKKLVWFFMLGNELEWGCFGNPMAQKEDANSNLQHK